MLDVVAESALKIERAHYPVAPPLKHRGNRPDSQVGEAGKCHRFVHFTPTFGNLR
jgi:hypothetical protein